MPRKPATADMGWRRIRPPEPLAAAEVIRRINARECLRCLLPDMRTNPATGFPDHYCADCAAVIALEESAARARSGETAARAAKRRKEEGIENLKKLGA